jgi:DNA-binding MarR family transcriptional regulator
MPAAAPTREEFAARLVTLLPRLSRGISQRDLETISALTLPQMWALEYLLDEGPCTMRVLAAGLRLRGSTATGLVDQLELRRLVLRRRSREDRRVVRVALTARVRRRLELVRAQRHASLMHGFEKHSAAERASFLKSVEKLVLGLAEPAPAAGRPRPKDEP